MARAKYIWIVKFKQTIQAAFTVKHELITYLELNPIMNTHQLKVIRVTDGPYYDMEFVNFSYSDLVK